MTNIIVLILVLVLMAIAAFFSYYFTRLIFSYVICKFMALGDAHPDLNFNELINYAMKHKKEFDNIKLFQNREEFITFIKIFILKY